MRFLAIPIFIILFIGCAAYMYKDPFVDKICDQCGSIEMFRREEANQSSLICDNCIRRNDYINSHPSLWAAKKTAILNGDILIGMSQNEVIASMGGPSEINRSVYEWGIHEQWIYNILTKRSLDYYNPQYHEETKYLYFEDGILKSWQD